MRFVIALFCAAATAAAQSAGGASKPAKVEGKVTHSITGAPLPRVNVTLMPSGRNAAALISTQGMPQAASSGVTGADGVFSLTNVPAGEYGIRMERNGFLLGSIEPTSSVTVVDGKDVTGLVVKMLPQAVIVVKVVDENGDPVNRAMVQVLRSRFQRGRRQMMPTGVGQTNDLGEYRVPSLNAATYYVSASPGSMNGPFGSIPVRQSGQVADEIEVTTYFPGTTETANATPITLTAGQEVSITIPMRKGRAYRVRGTAPTGPAPTGPASTGPASNGQLTMMPRGEAGIGMLNLRRSASVRPDGTFELSGVSPGSYTLQLLRPNNTGPVTPNAQATIEVVNQDLEGVTLAPLQALTLKGRVVIEGNEQAGDKIDLTGARVFPSPMDNGIGTNFGSPQNTVAADGTFALENIYPGRYTLQLLGSNVRGVYLKTVRQGGTDVTKTGLNLTEGSAGAQVELIYSRKAGAVVVTVTREPARKLGTVLLVPESPSAFDAVAASLGFVPVTVIPNGTANGTANAPSIMPGKYRVYALENLDVNDFDPEILKRVESKSERITVAEGETVNVTVKQLLLSDLEAR